MADDTQNIQERALNYQALRAFVVEALGSAHAAQVDPTFDFITGPDIGCATISDMKNWDDAAWRDTALNITIRGLLRRHLEHYSTSGHSQKSASAPAPASSTSSTSSPDSSAADVVALTLSGFTPIPQDHASSSLESKSTTTATATAATTTTTANTSDHTVFNATVDSILDHALASASASSSSSSSASDAASAPAASGVIDLTVPQSQYPNSSSSPLLAALKQNIALPSEPFASLPPSAANANANALQQKLTVQQQQQQQLQRSRTPSPQPLNQSDLDHVHINHNNDFGSYGVFQPIVANAKEAAMAASQAAAAHPAHPAGPVSDLRYGGSAYDRPIHADELPEEKPSDFEKQLAFARGGPAHQLAAHHRGGSRLEGPNMGVSQSMPVIDRQGSDWQNIMPRGGGEHAALMAHMRSGRPLASQQYDQAPAVVKAPSPAPAPVTPSPAAPAPDRDGHARAASGTFANNNAQPRRGPTPATMSDHASPSASPQQQHAHLPSAQAPPQLTRAGSNSFSGPVGGGPPPGLTRVSSMSVSGIAPGPGIYDAPLEMDESFKPDYAGIAEFDGKEVREAGLTEPEMCFAAHCDDPVIVNHYWSLLPEAHPHKRELVQQHFRVKTHTTRPLSERDYDTLLRVDKAIRGGLNSSRAKVDIDFLERYENLGEVMSVARGGVWILILEIERHLKSNLNACMWQDTAIYGLVDGAQAVHYLKEPFTFLFRFSLRHMCLAATFKRPGFVKHELLPDGLTPKHQQDWAAYKLVKLDGMSCQATIMYDYYTTPSMRKKRETDYCVWHNQKYASYLAKPDSGPPETRAPSASVSSVVVPLQLPTIPNHAPATPASASAKVVSPNPSSANAHASANAGAAVVLHNRPQSPNPGSPASPSEGKRSISGREDSYSGASAFEEEPGAANDEGTAATAATAATATATRQGESSVSSTSAPGLPSSTSLGTRQISDAYNAASDFVEVLATDVPAVAASTTNDNEMPS